MKCETWYCKPYLIRRNFTRFWPAWAGFLLTLVLWVLSSSPDWPERLSDFAFFSLAVGLVAGFGLIAALLVFGYLFTPRYANTVHSLPVGREGLFLTNLLSGLALMAAPLAAAGLLALVRLNHCGIVLTWVGRVAMVYFYGFALGVLASVLAGTRLGAITLWGLMAIGPCILEALVKTAAGAVLWGVETSGLVLDVLCPVVYADFALREAMTGYMLWVDLASVGLLALALLLYRVRKTEATGDFSAFTWLSPVIKLLLTVLGGIILGVILALVLGVSMKGGAPLAATLAWLLPGLLIARMTAEMLVSRTVRVFSKKRIIHYALCVAVAAGIMLLVNLDPIGLQSRVPNPEDVAKVEYDGWYLDGSGGEADVSADPAAIRAVTELHQALLDNQSSLRCGDPYVGDSIVIRYTMKDGSTLNRSYWVLYHGMDDPVRDIADRVNNLPQPRLEYLLGVPLTRENLLEKVVSVEVSGREITGTELESILEALWQDLQEGAVTCWGAGNPDEVELEVVVERRADQYQWVEIRSCCLTISSAARNTWPLLETIS